MTTEILDSDHASIFCSNCNRIIIRKKSNLKEAVQHCYHLLDKNNQIHAIGVTDESLKGIKNFLERGTNNKYQIKRCDK